MSGDMEKSQNKIKCGMCSDHYLKPILKADGTESELLACANCDDPKGIVP